MDNFNDLCLLLWYVRTAAVDSGDMLEHYFFCFR